MRHPALSWALPYVDHNASFWEQVAAILPPPARFSVYVPLPDLRNGRPPLPAKHLSDFLQNRTIVKSVLLNGIVHEQPVDAYFNEIRDPLTRLQEESNVREVVVTDPILACRIKEELPQLRVAGSVLMDIRTPYQLSIIGDVLDVLTPSGSVLRDLNALSLLRQTFKGALRLLLNEGCLPGCPYRTQHFYEMGCGVDMPQSLCGRALARQPELALRGAWVLPQHLSHYDGLYDEVKLAGRVTLCESRDYLRVLSAYVHATPLAPREIGGGPALGFVTESISDRAFTELLRTNSGET